MLCLQNKISKLVNNVYTFFGGKVFFFLAAKNARILHKNDYERKLF